jgi:hypothetical protein
MLAARVSGSVFLHFDSMYNLISPLVFFLRMANSLDKGMVLFISKEFIFLSEQIKHQFEIMLLNIKLDVRVLFGSGV